MRRASPAAVHRMLAAANADSGADATNDDATRTKTTTSRSTNFAVSLPFAYARSSRRVAPLRARRLVALLLERVCCVLFVW
jgi:hypothetical protein